MLSLLFLIIQLSFALCIFFLTLAFITGAPFVPSTNPVTTCMIDLAQLKPGMVIYDLGSGDGRVLRLAASKGVKAIGYEINPFLVIYSKLLGLLSPNRKHIYVKAGNFWRVNVSDADVIFVYLLPWKMQQLGKRLKNICRPNTLIVSNSFIFPNSIVLRKDEAHHVYVFRMRDLQ